MATNSHILIGPMVIIAAMIVGIAYLQRRRSRLSQEEEI